MHQFAGVIPGADLNDSGAGRGWLRILLCPAFSRDIRFAGRDLQARARLAPSLPELLGIEGDAAARYFSAFETMLTAAVRRSQRLKLDTRARRPTRDPVNAALNFCYGMLFADVTRAIVACGLDPHAGFLHSGRNKAALALDLSEEFRPPVADAVVIAAFNNGEVKVRDSAPQVWRRHHALVG